MHLTSRLAIGLVLASLAGAQTTLHVPASYPSIQTAILASSAGDTVLVAPGTYFENVDFAGKNVTVRSSGGSAVTTIDGGQAGSVVRFVGGESAAAVLDGFTITNGRGANGTWVPQTGSQGGGIHVGGGSPTIRNCVITGNAGGTGRNGLVSPPQGCIGDLCRGSSGGGGGIQVRSLTAASMPTIEHCTVFGNTGGMGGAGGNMATGYPQEAGRGGAGGIDVEWASMNLRECAVDANVAGTGGSRAEHPSSSPATAWGGAGGAGGVDGPTLVPGHVSLGTIEFCTFTDNVGGDGGTTFNGPSPGGFGGAGGISGNFLIRGCVVSGNRGGSGVAGGGTGGIKMRRSSPSAVEGSVIGCLVDHNIGGTRPSTLVLPSLPPLFVFDPQPGTGGIEIASLPVIGSVIAFNQGGSGPVAAGASGGVRASAIYPPATPLIVNCTVIGNLAGTGNAPLAAGIHAVPYQTFGGIPVPFEIVNTAVWGPGSTPFSWAAGTPPVVTHSLVEGGYPGPGNLDADPLLADPVAGDFHLMPGSPCIDAGLNGVTGLPTFDVEGDPRVFHGTVDIGADESILTLRLTQAAPGAPVAITNENLELGHEYYNVFSAEPCAGPPGSGPFLGLCATVTSFLEFQFLLPVGAEPIHFVSPVGSRITWGPYAAAPGTLEGVCFDWTGGSLGPVSAVVRFTIH